jgi:hypothetical protein
MTVRWRFIGFALAACCVSCGSDDAIESQPSGAGAAGANASSAPVSHQPAVVPADDPAPPCNRFDFNACTEQADRQCRVAIRKSAEQTEFQVYSACVTGVPGKRLDSPCQPWGERLQRHEAPGLEDELYVDPCGLGLICTDDLVFSGNHTCRPICDFESDRLCQRNQLCASGARTEFEQACLPIDACDPTQRGACGEDNECYLRPNDVAKGVITVCLPLISDAPFADGAKCESTFNCRPGSWCWGPADRRPGDWTESEQICRPVCALPDAGTTAPECGADQVCKDLTGAKTTLDFTAIPIPLAQCE